MAVSHLFCCLKNILATKAWPKPGQARPGQARPCQIGVVARKGMTLFLSYEQTRNCNIYIYI